MLILGLGTAIANPWGLPGEAGGSRDHRPPPPDWIQGTDDWRGREPRGGAPGAGGYDGWSPAGSAPDAAPRVPTARPTWGGQVAPAAPAAPAGPAAWPGDPPDYRFRPGGTEAPTPRDPSAPRDGAWSEADYHFRERTAQPPADALTWPDLGGYQFRPLSERERTRQGREGPSRPPYRAPAAAPDWGQDPGQTPQFGPFPARGPALPRGYAPPDAWAPP